jgi:MFS transporter, SP family, arabinose:H+ symporter
MLIAKDLVDCKMRQKTDRSFLMTITGISAMGGLLFGYDWVVIGGAKPFYERFFGITGQPYMQGWAMGAAILGCLIGAGVSGVLSDRMGRKRSLILSALIFLLSSLATGAAGGMTSFILYRIAGGIGIGLASSLSPTYISEISPAHLRGRLVSINQLTIVLGILAAQIINWQIAEPVAPGISDADILVSWNGQWGWRWMFWATAVPSLVFFLAMFFVPESPRWLIQKGRDSKVTAILTRIGGTEYAGEEMKRISESLTQESGKTEPNAFRGKGVRRILILGIGLAVFQQWCGINVIFNYAEEIFSAAGYSVSDILFNILITGTVNLLFTFLAMATVDRWGRRKLMLTGAFGLAVIYAFMGYAYYAHITGWPVLLLVISAIACYSMSLAPVTWVVLSEIFPNKVRGASMAIATFGLWSACFLLTYTFPLFNAKLGASGTFWMYGLICIAGYFFIYRNLPETRGKTLEAIETEITA